MSLIDLSYTVHIHQPNALLFSDEVIPSHFFSISINSTETSNHNSEENQMKTVDKKEYDIYQVVVNRISKTTQKHKQQRHMKNKGKDTDVNLSMSVATTSNMNSMGSGHEIFRAGLKEKDLDCSTNSSSSKDSNDSERRSSVSTFISGNNTNNSEAVDDLYPLDLNFSEEEDLHKIVNIGDVIVAVNDMDVSIFNAATISRIINEEFEKKGTRFVELTLTGNKFKKSIRTGSNLEVAQVMQSVLLDKTPSKETQSTPLGAEKSNSRISKQVLQSRIKLPKSERKVVKELNIGFRFNLMRPVGSVKKVDFGPGPLGMNVSEIENKVIVTSMRGGDDGTPGQAESSHRIRIGDQIVAVQKKSVIGMKMEEVFKCIAEAGRPVVIEFQEYERIPRAAPGTAGADNDFFDESSVLSGSDEHCPRNGQDDLFSESSSLTSSQHAPKANSIDTESIKCGASTSSATDAPNVNHNQHLLLHFNLLVASAKYEMENELVEAANTMVYNDKISHIAAMEKLDKKTEFLNRIDGKQMFYQASEKCIPIHQWPLFIKKEMEAKLKLFETGGSIATASASFKTTNNTSNVSAITLVTPQKKT